MQRGPRLFLAALRAVGRDDCVSVLAEWNNPLGLLLLLLFDAHSGRLGWFRWIVLGDILTMPG